MESLSVISKEFLEDILGRKVESFTIYAGSNVGDNYTSILYSIDVQVRKDEDNNNESETLHLLSKCYPAHPARQEFLNNSNIFWNELSVYRVLIPELSALARRIGKVNDLFPPLIGGKAINFKKLQEFGDKSYDGKVFNPFDFYIMMTDMRKARNFRMADRLAGLNYDEIRLVISAQARLHALSWCYKQLNGLDSLVEKFDFLKINFCEEDLQIWLKISEENIQMAVTAVENLLGKNSELIPSLNKLKNNIRIFLDIFFDNIYPAGKFGEAHRIPPKDQNEDEEPWKVLIHGDCWTNNMLFRYDAETSKPIEVVLVDLQLMREHCPTLDLAYLIYCSTTTEFRKKHMTSMLKLYYEEFTNYCDLLNVPLLPGFTLKELTSRFNRAKIFGYLIATIFLPIMLKDAKEITDLETVPTNNVEDVWKSLTVPMNDNRIYAKRIVSMSEELYAEGVL